MNKQYILVMRNVDYTQQFEEEITELLNDGWKCAGGIATGGEMLVQAMTKEDE